MLGPYFDYYILVIDDIYLHYYSFIQEVFIKILSLVRYDYLTLRAGVSFYVGIIQYLLRL